MPLIITHFLHSVLRPSPFDYSVIFRNRNHFEFIYDGCYYLDYLYISLFLGKK